MVTRDKFDGSVYLHKSEPNPKVVI